MRRTLSALCTLTVALAASAASADDSTTLISLDHYVHAMWEKNHLLLFKASLDWLKDGKVNGVADGELKLGY